MQMSQTQQKFILNDPTLISIFALTNCSIFFAYPLKFSLIIYLDSINIEINSLLPLY